MLNLRILFVHILKAIWGNGQIFLSEERLSQRMIQIYLL